MLSLNSALEEFLAETFEILDEIGVDLLKMEKNEETPDTLNNLYRRMHTIKGSAHLFGCKQMGEIAHFFENCLEPVRNAADHLAIDACGKCRACDRVARGVHVDVITL